MPPKWEDLSDAPPDWNSLSDTPPSNTQMLPRFLMEYMRSPEGRGVAERYGVTPEKLQEARQTVSRDVRNIPRATAETAIVSGPAVAGGMLGSGLGPAGTLAGAGLGYSIGQRLLETLGLSEAPASIPEAIGRSVEDVPIGAAQEATGQIGGKILGKILAPRASRVTSQGEQLSQTLKKAGVIPSPSDVAPGGVWPRLEAMAEKQVGGSPITEAGRREIEAMKGGPSTEGWIAREARRVSGPRNELDASRVSRGETIQQALQDIAQAHRVGEAVEWEFPRAQESGVPDFRIENLREMMRSRLAESGDVRQAIQPQTSARLSSQGGKITPEGAFVTERTTRSGMVPSEVVAGLAKGEGPITLRQAIGLRKVLGEMYKEGDKAPLAAFRQDMTADATYNPQRAQAWESARAYTRENIVPFYPDEPLGRLIDKGEPLAVVRELMQPRDARVNLLRAVSKQTGKTGPVWNAVNAEALTQALEKPARLGDLGPETKALLFTPEQRAFLDEVQNWATTSSASMKSERGMYARTGTNIVGYDQVRHAFTLLAGGAGAALGASAGSPATMITGGAILLEPALVAKMATNPVTARWLAQGFQTPAGSPEAMRVLAQLVPAYRQSLENQRRSERTSGMDYLTKVLETGKGSGVNRPR